MNKLDFDHFNNLSELLEHIDIWYKEYDIEYTRWFSLYDLKQLKDYIVDMQDKIDKAIEYIKTQQKIFEDYDVVVDNQLKNILEILGDKENER